MFQTPPRNPPKFSFCHDIIGDDFDPTQVRVEVIDLTESQGSDKFCVMLHNVMSAKECTDMIDVTERSGYEPALVNIGYGRQQMIPGVRNNDRCIIDDVPGTEKIWQRILDILNTVPQGHKLTELLHIPWVGSSRYHAVGLNERLRFLRYDPGTFFAPHGDGSYVRGKEIGEEHLGEQSFVTFQLYLNEGFEGGSTRFLSPHDTGAVFDAIPQTGSVLLFQHDCFHEGSLLVSGRKYAVRSDVMYARNIPESIMG